jgi:hypothetical protein
MTGAVSVQVVLALLVLSIAPLPRGADAAEAEQAEREGQAEASSSTIPLHITPLRAIGMAYEMGASLGLEERTKAAIARRENWGEGWYAERVSEALLVSEIMYRVRTMAEFADGVQWEMVKSRHTMYVHSCGTPLRSDAHAQRHDDDRARIAEPPPAVQCPHPTY